MKAIVFYTYGEPDVLKYEEIPVPEMGCKEVLVYVKACAINHLDVWVRKGISGIKVEFPHILGADISGIIENKGGEVTGLNIGDKVIVSPGVSCGLCHRCFKGEDNLCKKYKILGEKRWGGYADYVSVPQENIISMPAHLSFEEASCFPLTLLTAWRMVKKGGVKSGSTVLITAAGSGVSVMLIQICKLFGARVISASSSNEKLKKAEELGAELTINYAKEGLLEKVKEFEKEGADIVFDHTGIQHWEDIVRATAWGGKIVICGATSGYKALTDLRHIFFRQISIIGSTMGSKADLLEAIEFVKRKNIKPVMDRIFALKDAKEGHKFLEEGRIFGKIVLRI